MHIITLLPSDVNAPDEQSLLNSSSVTCRCKCCEHTAKGSGLSTRAIIEERDMNTKQELIFEDTKCMRQLLTSESVFGLGSSREPQTVGLSQHHLPSGNLAMKNAAL